MTYGEFSDRFSEEDKVAFIQYLCQSERNKLAKELGLTEPKALTIDNIDKLIDSLKGCQIWGSDMYVFLHENKDLYDGDISRIEDDLILDKLNWKEILERIQTGKIMSEYENPEFIIKSYSTDYICMYIQMDKDGIKLDSYGLNGCIGDHLLEDFDTKEYGQPLGNMSEEAIKAAIESVKDGSFPIDEGFKDEYIVHEIKCLALECDEIER